MATYREERDPTVPVAMRVGAAAVISVLFMVILERLFG